MKPKTAFILLGGIAYLMAIAAVIKYETHEAEKAIQMISCKPATQDTNDGR